MASRPSRALFVTQHFWPEMIGSAPYCTDIADYLAANGTGMTVFTCRPHYPEGVVPSAYGDGGRDRERRGDLSIERVPPWLPQRRNAVGRIFAELVFLLRGVGALATRRIQRESLVISLCPSILTVVLGILATRRKGRHIAVVHDIQSGLASGLGMVGSGPLVRLMSWVERVTLNRVTRVLVLSEDMRRRLRDQGVRTTIDLLPIWVDTQVITPRDTPQKDTVSVLYSGNFGKKQALGQIIDMAVLLERRNRDIVVTLRGAGGELPALTRAVAELGLGNVRFSPLVAGGSLADGLAEGDILLVPQNHQAADFAVPSKVYGIMAAGRPFVASANPGSMLWHLMNESQALLCVPPGDAAALADAVERLADDPDFRRELGRNGRTYVETHHDRAVVLQRFLTILQGTNPERIDHGRHATSSPYP